MIIIFILYSRTFSSAKNFVKSDGQAVQKRPSGCSSGIYFRQTPVGSRLLFSRSIVALLIVIYFYIHDRIFLIPIFRFVKKISQEFNLVKKLLDESDEIKFLTKISCNTVHDEEEEEDDDDRDFIYTCNWAQK